ncbi:MULTISPECIES: hypothetical protein [Bacillaceae]|nr:MULTISPECIES: hypothetical protein [Bacillaceae]MDL0436677.1 hypothetical protein [Niallia sp. SS-2023]
MREIKGNPNFDYDENGHLEVTAQVMDAYNDGAIDSLIIRSQEEK